MRHINISLLWIQDKTSKEELTYEKVLGTENLADMMTKNLEAIRSQKFSPMLQQVFREGRARESLRIQKTGSAEGQGVIA